MPNTSILYSLWSAWIISTCVSKHCNVYLWFCLEGVFNCYYSLFKCKPIMSLLKVKKLKIMQKEKCTFQRMTPWPLPPPSTIKSSFSFGDYTKSLSCYSLWTIQIYLLSNCCLVLTFTSLNWVFVFLFYLLSWGEMEYIVIFPSKVTEFFFNLWHVFNLMIWFSRMK